MLFSVFFIGFISCSSDTEQSNKKDSLESSIRETYLDELDNARIKVQRINASQTKRTTIAITPDAEIDTSNNVIYCASFQIAWNSLKDTLGEDVQLDVSNEVIDNLNESFRELLQNR